MTNSISRNAARAQYGPVMEGHLSIRSVFEGTARDLLALVGQILGWELPLVTRHPDAAVT